MTYQTQLTIQGSDDGEIIMMMLIQSIDMIRKRYGDSLNEKEIHTMTDLIEECEWEVAFRETGDEGLEKAADYLRKCSERIR